jgi:SAM-dependent methyltransferase/uncharacterized protein YbaR (Trm112 family)
MRPWLHAFLACQECSGELTLGDELESQDDDLITGSVECAECELSWPVLGGVPLMLSDPGAYLASYRESVLTSLVEVDRASPAALAIVDEFGSGYENEALRYGDDWTAEESGGSTPTLPASSPAQKHFAALVQANRECGLHATVLKLLDNQRHDSIVEVGPGAGGLSRLLAERCDRLVLVDLSLRSLLRSQTACAGAGAKVAAMVGDAAALELASDCAHAVVAANVVDLLEAPEPFLVSVSRWLVRRGEFILTTPDPSLGSESDDALADLVASLEYQIDEQADGIPWIRRHSARYSQLYWLQALRASILS